MAAVRPGSSKTSLLVDRERIELIVVHVSSEDCRSLTCFSFSRDEGRDLKGDGGK